MISWFEKHKNLSWLIVILVAIFIFYISGLSFEKTGIAFADWKTTAYHFLIFSILGFFLLISLVRGRHYNLIVLAIILAIIYAISDEFHQLFVPGRSCNFQDIITDSAGILFSGVFYVFILNFRKNKQRKLLQSKQLP